MGLENPLHILLLLVVVLLVFGARRLPEIGHSLGSGLRGFKDSLAGHEAQASLTAAQPQETHLASAAAVPPGPGETHRAA
jgi:sec-independent protein translocase protein TatA